MHGKILTTLMMAFVISVLVASPALAAKQQNVIALSNGFPSGEHFNLNVHGKDPARFIPDLTVTGGNSVFVSLYGDSTLTFKSDKRGTISELTALDPYAEAFDGTPAKVQLPYETEGYYVFARILGKPNNGSNQEASSIILTPNSIPLASNYDPADSTGLLTLGLVATSGTYELDEQGLLRFDPNSVKGKGKSSAVDITGLFLWTGWVIYDLSLDSNADGVVDINDVPLADYDADLTTPDNHDFNNDGVEDAADTDAWLQSVVASDPTKATYFDNEWIFNIADIVEQSQTISNDGTRLLQIRFYPVDTTQFIR